MPEEKRKFASDFAAAFDAEMQKIVDEADAEWEACEEADAIAAAMFGNKEKSDDHQEA
jgi:hypothetical protein